MKFAKLFSLFVIFLFFLSIGFSEGFYDSKGEFTYYVSNSKPEININISSGTRKLRIETPQLLINDELSELVGDNLPSSDSPHYLNRFEEAKYNFGFEDENAISSLDFVHFKLFVYANDSAREVKPEGDPVDFDIEFDNEAPKLLDMVNLIDTQNKLRFRFDEPIRYLKVAINGNLFTNYDNLGQNLRLKSEDYIDIVFPEDFFEDEVNTLDIEYFDFAMNKNESSDELYVRGEDLSIELVTLKEDSSLKYNFEFDSDFVPLFGNNLYTSEDSFDLKIKTNKEAHCYFASGINEGDLLNLDGATDKDLFDSMDGLTHTYSLTQYDKVAWVACQNKFYMSEVKYLGEFVGIGNKEILNVVKYDEDSIKIETYQPKSLVSSNKFDLVVDTNNKAICYYKIDSEDKILMSKSDNTFKSYRKDDLNLNDGTYSLSYECFDVMAKKDKISYSLKVDSNAGIRVTDWSPKFTDSSNIDVEISLSEADVSCTYGKNRTAKNLYQNLKSINGTGVSRSFNFNLAQGKNKIYVYCGKTGAQTTENLIEIIYDTRGVVMSNIKFVNGDYLSNYVGSTDEINFEFNVTSLIPVKEYVAVVYSDNSSESFKLSAGKLDDDGVGIYSGRVNGDFNLASKIKVYGVNMLDKNTSIEKNILFDLTPPQIVIGDLGGGKTITCSDLESGCADVYYGLSQTSMQCSASKKYNGTVFPEESNYICAKGYNYVGVNTFEIVQLGDFNGYEDDNLTFSDLFGIDFNETEDEDSEDDSEDDSYYDDPFTSGGNFEDEGGSATTYALIGAIFLVLAGAGGGGYYAYKKGYLNDELKKLGIKVKDSSSSNSSSTQNNAQFTTKPIKNETKNSKNLKKGKYDDHLKKLNKFVDDKVNNSNEVFDNFNETTRGKTRYDDTLAKGKLNRKGDVSKEEFDEFYETSKSGVLSGKNTLESEAESFEKYYKEKKNKKEDSSSKKSN